VVALTRVGVAASEEDDCLTAQAPTPPTTTKATVSPTIVGRLPLKIGALRRTGVPFVRQGWPPCLAEYWQQWLGQS
jgi:hypothetical protein